MASLFASRRKAKRVASSDARDDTSQPEEETGPVVRRPTGAPKSKSKLRISFDPSESTEADNAPTTKPPRLGASTLSTTLPRHGSNITDRQDSDRPTYNKSYLDELKGSTPTTPKDLSRYNSSTDDESPASHALDVASKFGSILPIAPSTIPSTAEIQEKKDRRARLAKEQQAAGLSSTNGGGSIGHNDDYVSLDAYNSDGEFKPSRLQVASYNRADQIQDAQEFTRLIPEDEDIAEGFDDFVDDSGSNRILMSRATQRTQDARDKKTLRALIAEAEGGASLSDNSNSDNESSSSNASLEQAYNTAQTSHGTTTFGGSHNSKTHRRALEREATRPRPPEKTTPIPTLTTALTRLRDLKDQADSRRQLAETRKVEIQTRLREIETEKGRIQDGLEDLGRQLEEVRIAVVAGVEDGDGRAVNGHGSGKVDRGLENIGSNSGGG